MGEATVAESFRLFGREPALYLGVISAALVLLGTQGFSGMTPEHASLWIALLNTIVAAVGAWTTRPIAPSVFTGAVAAAAALASSYGFELSTEAVGAVNSLVIAALSLIVRGEVTPQETKVSKTTVTLAA